MKEMLILTGPQGAGNHFWSKIFSMHSNVYGWRTLLENYWEAHRFSEPFAKHWKNPTLLDEFNWDQSQYYFTSMSVPLGIYNYKENPIWVPDLMRFADMVEANGVNVRFAVIGRERNILEHQQKRIRGDVTYQMFLEQLENLPDPVFLSYELLHLYKRNYLKSVRELVNIPVAWNDPKLDDILSDDSNQKYIHNIEKSELDQGNRMGTTFKQKPK